MVVTERLGDVLIVHVVGTVERSHVEDFAAALADATHRAEGPLLVSFLECTALHPAGLSAVENAWSALDDRFHVVVAPGSAALETLQSSERRLPIKESFRHAGAAARGLAETG